MNYLLGGAIGVVCILIGVYVAKSTDRMQAGTAALWTLFLGPIGLAVVLWKCINPAAGIAALVVGVGALLGIAYVTTPDVADIPRIERQIAFDLRQGGAVRQVEVDCPDAVDWEPGQTFDCTAFGGGDSAKIKVLMEDDGKYEWSP